MAPPPVLRASAPFAVTPSQLGPLTDLAGTWVGNGFDLISLPDRHDSQPLRLQLNATREMLQFTPIGGFVPNRGSGQDDIFLFGLTYLQRVSDSVTNEAMHIEPGLWLNVPSTSVPAANATVVRQASVPHGNSLLAQGTAVTLAGGPQIPAVDSTPAGPGVTPDSLTPFVDPPLPPGFTPPSVKNPNLALERAILGQDMTGTVQLTVSTTPSGGIINIPFGVHNANATKLDAIFWIESVQQPDGSTFLQLQYTQTVVLNFRGIDCPHISVATLVKQ
jgi:hypothetical protein